jgi:hypothetical protein
MQGFSGFGRRLLLVGLVGAAMCVGVASPSANAGTLTSRPMWLRLAPTKSPAGRAGSSMAYDVASGQLVLFGGITQTGTSGFRNDTWIWSGTTWTELSPPSSPSLRYGASMVYDATMGEVVLFGGYDGSVGSNVYLGDTWTWNGTVWTVLSPATSPPGRVDASMAYDGATGTILLYGGLGPHGDFADTWSWNGATWTRLSPAKNPGTLGDASPMTYDPATHSIVFVAGARETDDRQTPADDYVAATWTWTGTNWVELDPKKSPPARDYGTMTYDSQNGTVVLFGGDDILAGRDDYLNDTWAWSGATWQQLSPPRSPAKRFGNVMDFDPSTGTVILFGGVDSNGFLGDTWAFGNLGWWGSSRAASVTHL